MDNQVSSDKHKSRKPQKPKQFPKQALRKQYIKFLARSRNTKPNVALLKNSPDDVIKILCNACLNASCGQVKLTPSQKKILNKYKNPISKLATKGPSIKQKRRVLVQKGGAIFLPILLSAVLSTLGSALFSK